MAVDVEPSAVLSSLSSVSGEDNAASHGSSSSSSLLHYRFTVSEGSSPHTSDYGIQLAEMCGLPPKVSSVSVHTRYQQLVVCFAVPAP